MVARFTSNSLKAAKRVIIGNMSVADAAKLEGIHVTNVFRIVKDFRPFTEENQKKFLEFLDKHF